MIAIVSAISLPPLGGVPEIDPYYIARARGRLFRARASGREYQADSIGREFDANGQAREYVVIARGRIFDVP